MSRLTWKRSLRSFDSSWMLGDGLWPAGRAAAGALTPVTPAATQLPPSYGPRYGRCRCTPCTDMSVGAQRPHPLPRCVSECYTFSASYTEVPTSCPHRYLGYSQDVHTGGARE